MAKKGGTKAEKRISTSKVRKIHRKEMIWTIRTEPGPHKRKESLPLGFIVRDILKLAKNMRETKYILNRRFVKVDGVARASYKFPVGLFDLISFEKQKKVYRIVYDKQGRLIPKEVDAKEQTRKICKITSKKTVKGGLTQITTNDGRTFREKAKKYKVGDSLEVKVPENKISAVFEVAKGNIAYVSGGTHISTVGKITEITEGTMKRKKLMTLQTPEKDEFQTTENNIIVIGEKKEEIDVKAA